MWFIVHLKDNEMICKTVHAQHAIMTYIEQNGLIKEECKIFDGNRMEWNECYKEWDHAIIVECSKCHKDMTGWKHGTFPCNITHKDGCPDKGDGGW